MTPDELDRLDSLAERTRDLAECEGGIPDRIALDVANGLRAAVYEVHVLREQLNRARTDLGDDLADVEARASAAEELAGYTGDDLLRMMEAGRASAASQRDVRPLLAKIARLREERDEAVRHARLAQIDQETAHLEVRLADLGEGGSISEDTVRGQITDRLARLAVERATLSEPRR